MSASAISPRLFQRIAGLLREHAGMELGADKTYLLESRLTSVLRRFGLADYGALERALSPKPPKDLLDALIDAMTTNETLFFRDLRPFRFFSEQVLPELVERRAAAKTLRIWSAAASTGQEAYSLAICVEEFRPPLTGWRIDILGTDISTESLAAAERGRYSQFEVQRGLPTRLLIKYFTQKGSEWEVKEAIRRHVRFLRHNLLEPATRLGSFDVVFLRNVLIYMDQNARRRVVGHVAAAMAPGGYLFLGATETLREKGPFAMVPGHHAIYRLPPQEARAPERAAVEQARWPRPAAVAASPSGG